MVLGWLGLFKKCSQKDRKQKGFFPILRLALLVFYYLRSMIEKEPLHLNKTFKYALDLLEKTPTSAFITGRAGTGKSTLLKLFRNSTRKKVVVLAPTGVAALNVQGQTIHSFLDSQPNPYKSKIFENVVKEVYTEKWKS